MFKKKEDLKKMTEKEKNNEINNNLKQETLFQKFSSKDTTNKDKNPVLLLFVIV